MTVEDLRTGEKEKVKVGGYVMIAGNPQKPGYYVGEVESFFDLRESPQLLVWCVKINLCEDGKLKDPFSAL